MLAEFSNEIATRRKSARLTQSALAQASGTSRATIDALENGRAGEIGYTKLTRILGALGLELRLQDANYQRPTLEQLLADDSDLDR